MTAYVIVHLTPVSDDRMAAYRALARPALQAAGGRVLAKGPATPLEGEADPAALVIAFDSADAARAWYDSPAYQNAIAARDPETRFTMAIVPGV